MNPINRFCLIVGVLFACASSLVAQTSPGIERPGVNVPIKPSTQKDLDRLEALKLYAKGRIDEKNQRLLEALKAFEQAVRLDPDAAELHRALIPLYQTLERNDDALAEFKRVVELDPADVETRYQYARQLREQNQTKEALTILKKTVTNEALKDRAELRAQLFFDIAGIHEDAGQWAEAEKALRELAAVLDDPALIEESSATPAEIDAQAAETWERIGRLCIKLDQRDKAVIAFQTVQKKNPAGAQHLAFDLAELNEKQGKFREALTQLDNYLRIQPQGVEGYEMKIRLLHKLNRDGDVPVQLEAASKNDPHNAALKLLLAREYRRTQPGRAEAVYLAMIQDNPSPEAFKGLLAVYKDDNAGGRDLGAERLLRFFNESVKAIDKGGDKPQPRDENQAAIARGLLTAAREDPDMVQRMLLASQKLMRSEVRGGQKLALPTRRLLAALAARTHQLDIAEELYRNCLTQDGELPKDIEFDIYSGLLTVLYHGHKYKEMLDVCKLGLEKAERSPRVMFHVDKVSALTALGRLDEAVAAAEAGVKDSDEKNRLYARRILAETLSQAGKHEQALAECQALLKEYNHPGEDKKGDDKESDVRSIRLALSTVYLAMHKYEESEKELQLILENDPNDATVNNNLGYQWAERNRNLDEAEKLIRKALELDRKERNSGSSVGLDGDRDNAAYIDSLGWVLFRRGKFAEAREQMELAAKLPDGADDPAVWDHLGDVYFRLEEKTKALASWKKSLTLFEAGRRRDEERLQDVKKKIKLLEP